MTAPGTNARASAPIPFHTQARHYYGIDGDLSADQILRNVDSWAAIASRAIVDRLASLELQVCVEARGEGGERTLELLPDHELQGVINRPNPVHYSRRLLIRLIGHWLLNTGEAYLLKVHGSARGLPQEIWPMPPGRVTPILSAGIVTGYRVRDGDGNGKNISVEEVIRIWNPDPEDVYHATGVLEPQSRAKDTSQFIEEHHRHHYKSDATPKTVIKSEPDSVMPEGDELAAFKESWRQRYNNRTGRDAGLPKWLPAGFDIMQLQEASLEGQVQILEFLFSQGMMAYGVPRSIVGDVVDANRAAAETNHFVFDRNTVLPYAEAVAEAFTYQLAKDFDPALCVRFQDFVSDDKDHRLAQESQDLALKVRSVNQVRESRGLDPVEWGDVPVGSFNDVPYDPDPMEPMPEEEPPRELFGDAGAVRRDDGEQDESARGHEHPTDETEKETHPVSVERAWARVQQREARWQNAFADQMRAVLKEQQRAVSRLLAAHLRERVKTARDFDLSELLKGLRELFRTGAFTELFRKTVETVRRGAYRDAFEGAVEALEDPNPPQFTFTEAVRRELEHQADDLREKVNSETVRALATRIEGAIADGVEAGEGPSQMATRIRKSVSRTFKIRRNQALRIARTELVTAQNRAELDAYEASDVVVGKRWHTALDGDVRDSHRIERQTVPVDEQFHLGSGIMADHPGASNLPARDRINCRCFMTAVTSDKQLASELSQAADKLEPPQEAE